MRATGPSEGYVVAPAGEFRTLTWHGDPHRRVVLFLHGLSGVADVWSATIEALGEHRPPCVAVDLRGHGRSPKTPGRYRVLDHVGDLRALVAHLGAPVDLVGHSMGARVAFVGAARHPELFSSVTVVDIGPERWTANITATVELFASLPRSFPGRAAALTLGGLGAGAGAAERFVQDRLVERPDGSFGWLAPPEALVETVTVQRSRDYWRDWERISIPALLVRGERTRELRPFVLEEMLRRNPSVRFRQIEDVGHNIPLGSPVRLAEELGAFLA